MDSRTEQLDYASSQDRRLHRHLGFWSLVAAGVGSVIGSGWLFSAMYAAQAAGPAAIVSWLIGGGLMLLIALVFAELGLVKPESGGLVRYPLYTNGRMTASIIGWAMWLSYVGNPPTEASGVVQYASAYLPGVFSDEKLTTLGILLAVALMAVFVVINYFGVAVFAKSNNVVTAVKVCIPLITVACLIASGFDHRHAVGSHGGFAPYGWGAALGAIATAGLVFAYTGFRNIIELSGEARNPRKHLAPAMIVTILFTIVLYLALQVAFLVAVPDSTLLHGWSGVNFDSPFADLAQLLGFTWLYWLLIADSMVSPSGSGIVYTAANSRNVYGLAKNGFFPRWMMEVDHQRGVPVRALMLNFVVGIGFLLPLPSWHAIVEVMSAMAALTFSIGSVSVFVFRNVGLGHASARLPGMRIIAPLAFMVSSLVIFWEPWDKLWKTIPIVAVGGVWFVITYWRGERDPGDISAGLWLVAYLVFVYALSALGSFGGHEFITAPWDSIVVALGSLTMYFWGVRAGTVFLSNHHSLLNILRAEEEEESQRQAAVDAAT
ncbi:APC family permease [Gordonia sp. NPDC003425]